jgi:biotin operon repressor
MSDIPESCVESNADWSKMSIRERRKWRDAWASRLRGDGNLSPLARLVGLEMFYCNQFIVSGDGSLYLSAQRIADRLGIPKRNVTRALKELREHGWIGCRSGGRRIEHMSNVREANVYRMKMPPNLISFVQHRDTSAPCHRDTSALRHRDSSDPGIGQSIGTQVAHHPWIDSTQEESQEMQPPPSAASLIDELSARRDAIVTQARAITVRSFLWTADPTDEIHARRQELQAEADRLREIARPLWAQANDIRDQIGEAQAKLAESFETASADQQERELFDVGKQVCGKSAGGLIAELLKAKDGVVPHARAVIEYARTKHDPREYVARVVHGGRFNSREFVF